MTRRILVVTEGSELPERVRGLLGDREGARHAEVRVARSAEAALPRVGDAGTELVLMDVDLPGMGGIEALRILRDRDVETPIVLIAGRSSLEEAIGSMQEGASDFLVRPVRTQGLRKVLRRHLGTCERHEALDLPAGAGGEDDRLLGQSPGIVEVCKTLGRVAPTDATVLVSGESGTGKELIARLLHKNSDRREGPFQAVNCAAIPESLLESELFGHEKGAFTGADRRQLGKFEQADGGTLFLDEVGDMSLANQKKILRALEERAIERVGGQERIPVDVRVVAATNVDLWDRVKEEAFRRDLYYRLAVVNIRVPPLRERKEDIRLLTDHFVARFARRSGRPVERVASEVYERLESYDWPGNVRELRNVLERSVIMGQGAVLRADDLPELAPSTGGEPEAREGRRVLRRFCRDGMSLETLERRYIENVLDELGWHFGEASDVLQIHRNTLRRKIRRYGLEESASAAEEQEGQQAS